VNSVATLVLTKGGATSRDPFVLAKIRNCEGLWFAGGDQWLYYNFWKSTPIQDEIHNLIRNKKITVGGTSAGEMIQAAFPFTAQYDTIGSTDALANPYDRRVTIGYDFLRQNFMQSTVIDSHFYERDRMGRSLVFLARIIEDRLSSWGRVIAIDEATALLIDGNGIGSIVVQTRANHVDSATDVNSLPDGSDEISESNKRHIEQATGNSVYLLDADQRPFRCIPNTPLEFDDVRVQRLRLGDTVNMATFDSNGKVYSISSIGGKLQTVGNGGSIY